jgi:hypothetical protein
MNARLTLAAAALAAAFSLAAGAATPTAPQTANGVTYLSGGIGREEVAAIKAEAKNYPLSLVFSAGPRHAFVADVSVTIKDKAGKVLLDSVSGGPIVLLKLAPGRYTVHAFQGGVALNRTVHVAAHGSKQLVLHWPKA